MNEEELIFAFAAHAPVDIPEWFTHTIPEGIPAAPIPKDHRDAVSGEFEIKAEQWRRIKKTHEERIERSRYFAWRWHYAKEMLKAKDKRTS